MTPVPTNNERTKPTPESVLNDLIPVAKTLIENQVHQMEIQERVQLRQLELQHFRDDQQARIFQESIRLERHKFDRGFALLAFAVLVVVVFSGGLMFISHDVKSGLSILSHVGAVIAGLMTGLGWQKYRQQVSSEHKEP